MLVEVEGKNRGSYGRFGWKIEPVTRDREHEATAIPDPVRSSPIPIQFSACPQVHTTVTTSYMSCYTFGVHPGLQPPTRRDLYGITDPVQHIVPYIHSTRWVVPSASRPSPSYPEVLGAVRG